MGVQAVKKDSDTILKRIDAIIRELEDLRQVVLNTQTKQTDTNPAQQLYGVLGRGDWSEYDPDLDWQRFVA